MPRSKFKVDLVASRLMCCRFFGFLFCRARHMKEYAFDVDRSSLAPPQIYACPTLKLGYFLISMLGTLGAVYSARSGGILSSIPSIVVVSIVTLGVYIAYKLVSSLVLTFGKWRPLESVSNVKEALNLLSKWNREIFAAATLGGSFACLNIYEVQIAYVDLVLAVVIIVYGIIHRKWSYSIIGMTFVMYSLLLLILINYRSSLF